MLTKYVPSAIAAPGGPRNSRYSSDVFCGVPLNATKISLTHAVEAPHASAEPDDNAHANTAARAAVLLWTAMIEPPCGLVTPLRVKWVMWRARRYSPAAPAVGH